MIISIISINDNPNKFKDIRFKVTILFLNGNLHKGFIFHKQEYIGTSLAVQWLRLALPLQWRGGFDSWLRNKDFKCKKKKKRIYFLGLLLTIKIGSKTVQNINVLK